MIHPSKEFAFELEVRLLLQSRFASEDLRHKRSNLNENNPLAGKKTII
jgi:hypothetical protein